MTGLASRKMGFPVLAQTRFPRLAGLGWGWSLESEAGLWQQLRTSPGGLARAPAFFCVRCCVTPTESVKYIPKIIRGYHSWIVKVYYLKSIRNEDYM